MIDALERPTVLADAVSALPVDPGLRYNATVMPEVVDGETIYVASYPGIDFVRGQGSTLEEALTDLIDVTNEYVNDMNEAGVPLPPAVAAPRIDALVLIRPRTPVRRVDVDWTIRKY